MISSELWVCALEGRIAVGFRLLDPVVKGNISQRDTPKSDQLNRKNA